MKVKEVERFEGLVAGEVGFVKQKLYGSFRAGQCRDDKGLALFMYEV